MFFYTTLFIASLIVALVVLWLYHAIVDVGKVVYQAILPSSKGRSTAHLEHETIYTTVNETPTPWGWGEHSKPSQAARTAKIAQADSVPWGWPGNDRKIRGSGQPFDLNAGVKPAESVSDKKKEAVIGWPYREDKFEFAGKAYKVTRKVTPEKTNLQTTGKPWGW